MASLMFWSGLIAVSCGLGTIYGPAIGWIAFGCAIIPLSLVVAIAEANSK